MIAVQEADFNAAELYEDLRLEAKGAGAIVVFTGLVRQIVSKGQLRSMTLEHYPGMTEQVLEGLQRQSCERWPLQAVSIVHRVGTLAPDEQIVFVGVASAHRADAFAGCNFIMDTLKTTAPFWKKEYGDDWEHWVETKASDQTRSAGWAQRKDVND